MTNPLKIVREGNFQILEITLIEGENDVLELLCQDETSSLKLISIVSIPTCCDTNTFVLPSSTDVLKGCILSNIYEDPDCSSTQDDIHATERILTFEIHVYCTYKNILELLRLENALFKKLPKDIFNIIVEKSNLDFVFYRKNYSNGYYEGQIEIRINDV